MNWYSIDVDGNNGFWGKASKEDIRSIAYQLAETSTRVRVFKGFNLGKLQFTLVRDNGLIEEISNVATA